MQFSWKRIFKVLVSVILVLALGGGVYYAAQARPVKIWLASTISDNREHFLPCQELPFYPQVQKAIKEHQDIVEQVKNAGAFDISAQEIKCPSWDKSYYFIKGDILIQYDTHKQRAAIEKLLGSTFFGIPYRGENH